MTTKCGKHELYNNILNKIIDLNYPQDVFFTESALANEFNASRVVVRETLIQLCQNNILRTVPRIGYMVVQLTRKDIEDAIQARTILESGTLQTVLPVISDDDLNTFCDKVRYSFAIDAEDEAITTEKWWEANATFHLELIKLTGNNILYAFQIKILNLLKRANIQFFKNDSSMYNRKFNSGSHEQIIAAMKDRNLEEARTLLIKDIEALKSQFNFF